MPGTHDSPDGRRCNRCGKKVNRHDDDTWRCDWCRNRVERPRQKRNQKAREEQVIARTGRVNALRHKAEHPEHFGGGDLTEDELHELVAAGDGDLIDFGDDWQLADRLGLLEQVTAEDLLTADRMWADGSAKRVLQRAGISYAAYAASIGVTSRMVQYWAAGKNLPRNSKHRRAAAAALLAHDAGNRHDDSVLVAHGYEPTLKAKAQLESDHAEIWETSQPWHHCDGCKRWRRNQQRSYD
jgi:hypothetical protein